MKTKSNLGLRVGAMRERKEWKVLAKQLAAEDSMKSALTLLHTLLSTPRYAIAKASKFDSVSGKPVELKWVREKTGMQHMFYTGDDFRDFKLPYCLKELLGVNLVLVLRGNKETTVYKAGLHVGDALVVSYTTIQTGGGHNDSPTYSDAISVHVATFGV